ncbi:hypothetical protein FKM82_018676 [Ascaphus truei]
MTSDSSSSVKSAWSASLSTLPKFSTSLRLSPLVETSAFGSLFPVCVDQSWGGECFPSSTRANPKDFARALKIFTLHPPRGAHADFRAGHPLLLLPRS